MNHPTPADACILVTGLARNCGKNIARNLLQLRESVSAFKSAHFLVIESDSSDHTLTELEQAAINIPNFRYVSLGSLRARFPLRTDRIAHCRNTYIDQLRSHPPYSNVSYVLVTDLDGVSRSLTAKGLGTCWSPTAPRWDACAANQGDYYYDIWALRHPVWCPNDAWKEHDALEPIVGEVAAKEICIFSRMIHIPTNRPMIEVHSAFGGLAVYRREALLAAEYSGVDERGGEVCEHVGFHSRLREQGYHIFINPAMINARTTANSTGKQPLNQLRRLFRTYLPPSSS